MTRPKHPKKEIEEALKHAEEHGWTVEAGRGHWGILKCPTNRCCRGGIHCKKAINSSPRKPATHAKQIRSVVDKCEFLGKEDE